MDTDKKDSVESTEHKIVKQAQIEPLSLFAKDAHFVLNFKKAEKLTTAVYMITNFLSDEEPIKWKLRELMGELMSYMIIFKDKNTSERSHWGYEIKKIVLDITSRLEVATFAGLISEMNFEIVKKEFALLAGYVNDEHGARDDRLVLDRNIFNVDAPTPPREAPLSIAKPLYEKAVPVYQSYQREPVLPRESKGQKQKTNKHESRKEVILDMLRKKPEITIKDVSMVVKNCSEKTIQRELLAMVSTGVLKKEGERRWSKYRLA